MDGYVFQRIKKKTYFQVLHTRNLSSFYIDSWLILACPPLYIVPGLPGKINSFLCISVYVTLYILIFK